MLLQSEGGEEQDVYLTASGGESDATVTQAIERINRLKRACGPETRSASLIKYVVLDIRFNKRLIKQTDPRHIEAYLTRSGKQKALVEYVPVEYGDSFMGSVSFYAFGLQYRNHHLVLLTAAGLEQIARGKEWAQDLVMFRRASEILRGRNYVSLVEQGVRGFLLKS